MSILNRTPSCTIRSDALRRGSRRFAVSCICGMMVCGLIMTGFALLLFLFEEFTFTGWLYVALFLFAVFTLIGVVGFVASPRVILRVSRYGLRVHDVWRGRSYRVAWPDITAIRFNENYLELQTLSGKRTFSFAGQEAGDVALIRDRLDHYLDMHFGCTIKRQLEQRRMYHKAISRFPTWRACIIDRLTLFAVPITVIALLIVVLWLWELDPILKYLMAGVCILSAIFAFRWMSRARPDQWVPVTSRDALTA